MGTNIFNRLKKSQDGNFGIIFALVVVALLLGIGLAYDGSKMMSIKSKLNDAADSAALTAVKTKIQNGENPVEDAEAFFTANAAKLDNVTVEDVKIIVEKIQGSGGLKSQVTYKAKYEPDFMGMFGFKNLGIQGIVEAQAGTSKRINITFLIDNSASMGIGVTADDQDIVRAITGCALSCHMDANSSGVSSLDRARDGGATVRMDVARQAVRNLISRIEQDGALGNVFVKVLTFSNSTEHIYGPSNDLTQALNSLDDVDLTRSDNSGGTNLHFALENLTNAAQINSNNMDFTIIITDGLEDRRQDRIGGAHAIDPNFVTQPDTVYLSGGVAAVQPIDVQYCTALKNRGNIIYVLNTEYLPGTAGSFPIIAPILPDVQEQLLACATDSDSYVNAGSTDEILQAADDIYLALSKSISPRLSH